MSKLRPSRDALSSEALRRLEELIVQLNPLAEIIVRAKRREAVSRNEARSSNALLDGAHLGPVMIPSKPPKKTGRDLRLPPPGSFLRRWHKGQEVIVRVLETGFEYEAKRYRSLTAIAKQVTGAHWNGLLFFGLVRQEK